MANAEMWQKKKGKEKEKRIRERVIEPEEKYIFYINTQIKPEC